MSGAVLRFGYAAEPPTLDPVAAGGGSAATRDILRPVLPALFRLNARLRPEPELAARWPRRTDIRFDPFSVTVRLRTATWSDGKPITADDVRFSFDKLRTGPTGYRYRFLRSVDVRGPRLLTLRFDRLVRRWWALFSIDDMVLPAHAYSAEWSHGPTVSGGPFAFRDATEGFRVRLVRNDRYWGRRAELGGIDIVFVQDDETRFQLLERGELDGFFSEGEVNIGRRAVARGLARTDGPLDAGHGASGAWGPSWYELDLSTTLAAKTRRAFIRALDPKLVAEIFEDSAAPIDGVPSVFPASPGGLSGPWRGRGNLDEARRTLGGSHPSFEVAYMGTAGAIGTFMRFRLRDVGITPDLVGLDPDVFERDADSGKARPVLIRLRRGADAPDAPSYASFSREPGSGPADDVIESAETEVARRALTSGPVAGVAPVAWRRSQDALEAASTTAPLVRVRTWIVGRAGVTGAQALGAANGPFWNCATWRFAKPR